MGFPTTAASGSRSKSEAVLSGRPLTDAHWARIETFLPGKRGDRGRTAADNRLFVAAILWLARTAAPWSDLPDGFGSRRTAHRPFRRRTRAGVGEGLVNALTVEPDFEQVLIDATICKAQADACGAEGELRLTRSAAAEAG